VYIFIEGKVVECRIVASNALYSNMITTTFPRKLVSLDSWFSADVKMRTGSLIQLLKNVEIVSEEKVIVVFIKHDKRGIMYKTHGARQDHVLVSATGQTLPKTIF
jgi:hypothetical protein